MSVPDASASNAAHPSPPDVGLAEPGAGGSSVGLSDEDLRWLLERLDGMRSATEQRASITLSANALVAATLGVVASAVFIGDGRPRIAEPFGPLAAVLLALSATVLVASTIASVAAFVNIRTTSRRLTSNVIPSRVFLHSFDTMYRFKTYEEFEAAIAVASAADLRTAVVAHLWASHKLYIKRYLALQASARLFLASLLALGLASLGAVVGVVTR